MDEIKIRNINKGAYAMKKELEIKKALMSSPKKIMIRLKNGIYFSILPLFDNMNKFNLDENWRYTDQLTEDFFWRKSVIYTIFFKTGSIYSSDTLVDESGQTITDDEKIQEYIREIFHSKYARIILDYSNNNDCKKIYMNGRFEKITYKSLNTFDSSMIIKFEFSADEEDIEIETDNKQCWNYMFANSNQDE